MGSIFDIRSPQPKEAPTPTRTKKNGNGCILWFLVLAILVILGLNYSNQQTSTKPTPQVTPTKTQVDFDLFNNNPLNTAKIRVRVINASGRVNETEKIKTILIDAGFEIEQTTVTETIDDQTTIYFRNSEEAKAKLAEDALTTNYQIKTKESINLGQTYDLLVVIGQKK